MLPKNSLFIRRVAKKVPIWLSLLFFQHVSIGHCGELCKLNIDAIISIHNTDYAKFLPSCQATIASNFQSHLARSLSPGIDIDLFSSCIDSENFALKQFPEFSLSVYSPVSGKRLSIGPGNYGTITIKDQNGYTHRLLHNNIFLNSVVQVPLEPTRTLGIENGQAINKGETIGYLGKTKTTKDHVHYSIYKDIEEGCIEFLDPMQTVFDQETGAVINNTSSCISCVRKRLSMYISWGDPSTMNGTFSTIQRKGILCGKSIIKSIKWKNGENFGEATTTDDWNTWSLTISPGVKEGDTVELKVYGVGDNELSKDLIKYNDITPTGFKIRIN